MVDIARRPDILKKRLQRLLFCHKNPGREQVAATIRPLSELGRCYLFGGAVRDIALQGLYRFYSDLDFVVDCPSATLAKHINRLAGCMDIQQNKFGGYRIKCDKWWLDIWAVENTWAFKQNIIQFKSIHSLLETTILTWDSILYDISNNDLIASDDYFEQLYSGIIDIRLAENPNPKGALIKILRCLSNKPVTYINPKLLSYLQQQIHTYQFEKLVEYEKQQMQSAFLAQISTNAITELMAIPCSDRACKNPLGSSNLELI